MTVPLPHNEDQRLRTLRGLELLDTPPEPAFDLFARAAQSEAGSEIALVSLVDADRQWIKAKVGFDVSQTPRNIAFCAHAILEDETFCVEDASLDDRFRQNPLVVGAPHIRAYAGAPIIIDGSAVGTVCAISTRPRVFPQEVRRNLKLIAAAAADRMMLARQLQIQSRLLESAGDAVVIADPEGRITFWNKAAENIFGYARHEALGLSIADLVPPRLRAQHEAGVARIRAGGASKLQGKAVALSGLHRDGGEIPVELTLSLWKEGAERGYGAILRDCRERKALEEARAFSEAADRFLANMSHEIRTPLNGLLGLAQALQLTGLDNRQAEMVRLMKQSGQMLERVLGDVLDSARMRTGVPEVVQAPCDLFATLRDVAAANGAWVREKGLGYKIEVPDGHAWVITDRTRITQIISNLLANAIKFTAEGSVGLRCKRLEGTCWRLEVSDTGIGFSPEAAEHIFERFRQEDETITRRFGGSGLGLAISREHARALGGDVEGWASPGGGSTFALTLPLEECDPPAQTAPPILTMVGPPLKVLLAEDHEVNRKVVELLLAPTGANLTMVENGALAVEAFKQDIFDVILMDMHMPVMDGLSAISEIRRLEQRLGAKRTLIATLTASAFKEHSQAAHAAGADAHLTKPIVASELLRVIFASQTCSLESNFFATDPFKADRTAAQSEWRPGPPGRTLPPLAQLRASDTSR